ncbi:hypothetical protein PF010_g29379, partial [Phytophthora fragariae]
MIETTRYFYDDDVLAKMILAAEKNPSTKKLGQRVDEELMKRWTQERALETERTVIIAVVPANVDMHNTEILQAAQEADSNGTRTIAVVTKVDLVDAGAELAVHELLLNKKKRMHLGYHAVKCRSQRELTKGTSIDKGVANELAFFGQHEYW